MSLTYSEEVTAHRARYASDHEPEEFTLTWDSDNPDTVVLRMSIGVYRMPLDRLFKFTTNADDYRHDTTGA